MYVQYITQIYVCMYVIGVYYMTKCSVCMYCKGMYVCTYVFTVCMYVCNIDMNVSLERTVVNDRKCEICY